MRCSILPSLLLLALAVPLAGCDGDTPSGPPDSGPPPVDQCVSSADRFILTGMAGDGGLDGGTSDAGMSDAGLPDPTVIGPECAYGCLAQLLDPDPSVGRACMETCYEASPLGALTDGCRDCFIDAMYCTGDTCPLECLGADRSLCDACYDMYCKAAEDSCTGL